MIYGMYISASGAQVNMLRQDAITNNLANVETVGFKPTSVAIRQREVAREEDRLPFANSNELLERLGGGVMPMPTRVSLGQGPIETTGQPLDVALRGRGFLQVRVGGGEDGVRLTRDGRMTIDDAGRLVRSADGAPVLDASGQPIRLDPTARAEIRSDGTIAQRGEPVARLGLVDVADSGALTPEDAGLFRVEPGAVVGEAAGVSVVQGAVERSGTNAIEAMLGVTGASRAVQGNLRMISLFNDIVGRTITGLGRVS